MTNYVQAFGGDSEGFQIGIDTAAKVGFYGTAPITRPTAAAQAAITDPAAGTAAPTNGVLTVSGTFNSTILNNAFATIIAAVNSHRTALVNLGLIKGS